MNPTCPKCGNLMELKNQPDPHHDGRSKFWVCKKDKLRFKVGYGIIRSQSSQNLKSVKGFL